MYLRASLENVRILKFQKYFFNILLVLQILCRYKINDMQITFENHCLQTRLKSSVTMSNAHN